MSRADRRKAERMQGRTTKGTNRSRREYGLAVLRDVLELNTVERVTEKDRDAFMLPAYAKMQLLISGQFSVADYYDISEYIVFGLYLCHELLNTTNVQSQAQLRQAIAWISQSRETVSVIADRYNRVGKFGATGDELKDLQETISLVNDLVLLADKRHVERARRRTSFSMQELHTKQAQAASVH